LPLRPARPARLDGRVPGARTAAGGPGGAGAACGPLRLRLLPGRRPAPGTPAQQARPAPGGGEPARPGTAEPSPPAGDETGPPYRLLPHGRSGVHRVAAVALGRARDAAMVPPPVGDRDPCRPGEVAHRRLFP